MPAAEYRALGERLSEHAEGFPYPGLEAAAYAKLKSESDEFPEYSTHIDVLIKRFEDEGITVVVGKNGDVFILPKNSDDIENDSVFPKFLLAEAVTDEELKKLVLARR